MRKEVTPLNEKEVTPLNGPAYPTDYVVSLHGNPVWEAIWRTIKGWDISRLNNGLYSGPTGDDATRIYDAVLAALPAPAVRREEVEAMLDRYGVAAQELTPNPDAKGDAAAREYDESRIALLALVQPVPDSAGEAK